MQHTTVDAYYCRCRCGRCTSLVKILGLTRTQNFRIRTHLVLSEDVLDTSLSMLFCIGSSHINSGLRFTLNTDYILTVGITIFMSMKLQLPPSGVWIVATAGVPKSMEFFADTRHSYSTPRSTHNRTMSEYKDQ